VNFETYALRPSRIVKILQRSVTGVTNVSNFCAGCWVQSLVPYRLRFALKCGMRKFETGAFFSVYLAKNKFQVGYFVRIEPFSIINIRRQWVI
jgi:hypothetical protein